MEHDFIWMYLLIFLAFPLARIIPRLLSRVRGESYPGMQPKPDSNMRKGNAETPRYDGPSGSDTVEYQNMPNPSKPQTKDMVVLGELHRGARTFEQVQKNTGMKGNDLEEILEKLEKKDLLKVVQKKRMFGSRIELYPTDKGFREYYS